MKKKKVKQTGKTHKEIDIRFEAKKPGWRKSKKGKQYYENRKNRSDVRKYL